MYAERLLYVLWTSNLYVATLRTYRMYMSLSRYDVQSVWFPSGFRERGLLLTTIIKEDIETMVPRDYSHDLKRFTVDIMTWLTDTEYLCHRLPQMYYVCRGDNHTILSSFMNYHHIFNKSNITGAKWSRGCFTLRSNWVRTHFLMGFLLLNLQLFNFLCHVFPIIMCLFVHFSLVIELSVLRLPYTIWYL